MQTALLNKIAEASGRNEKEILLAKADHHTQKFLRLALDPFTTFGVTLDKKIWQTIAKAIASSAVASPSGWWAVYAQILADLAERKLTGNAATNRLLLHLTGAPSEEAAIWAVRVLHQDLRCGVSIKTVMKVFPGLIQPFEVALADKFRPGKSSLKGVGYVEPKLDGLRVTVVKGVAYTRNGNEVQGADTMLRELGSSVSLKDWVFDGEFIGAGTFEETISAARTMGQDNRGLVYNVFDVIRTDEWFSKTTRAFSARRADLEKLLTKRLKFVAVVPSLRVVDPSEDQITKYRDQFIKQGFEGAMWKADLPYAFKRSKAILKFKLTETNDGVIEAFEEGKGKNEGRLGAFVVRLENKIVVNVGGGFSDEQRIDFWKRRNKLKGMKVEIEYQNPTAKGSLRFPEFVRLRPDK